MSANHPQQLTVVRPVHYDTRKTYVPGGVVHDIEQSSGRGPQLPIMLHTDTACNAHTIIRPSSKGLMGGEGIRNNTHKLSHPMMKSLTHAISSVELRFNKLFPTVLDCDVEKFVF